jgi:hypothetical protein
MLSWCCSILSRRSRTLRLKSSSVHWSCVSPPEPPAAAERTSLSSSLCMSPFLLRCSSGFSIGQGERTHWEAKVVLSSWWLYSCCAIHRTAMKLSARLTLQDHIPECLEGAFCVLTQGVFCERNDQAIARISRTGDAPRCASCYPWCPRVGCPMAVSAAEILK